MPLPACTGISNIVMEAWYSVNIHAHPGSHFRESLYEYELSISWIQLLLRCFTTDNMFFYYYLHKSGGEFGEVRELLSLFVVILLLLHPISLYSTYSLPTVDIKGVL